MVYLPNLLYMDPKRVSMIPVTFQDFSGQGLAGVWREAGLFAWKPVQVPFLLWEGGGYSRGRLALMGPSFFFVYSPPLKVGITPACFGQILNSLLSNSAGGSGNLYLCIYDITANVPRNFIT